MRSHAIRRRRSRTISVTLPRVERRYRAEPIALPRFRRLSDASQLATRWRSRQLTMPFVEVPELITPSFSSPVHVLPDTHEFSKGRFKRERVLSGEALAKASVRPTVNLKALYYTRPDVMVCVRRKQRKEVLFALGKAGGYHKRPKYTEESKIICR